MTSAGIEEACVKFLRNQQDDDGVAVDVEADESPIGSGGSAATEGSNRRRTEAYFPSDPYPSWGTFKKLKFSPDGSLLAASSDFSRHLAVFNVPTVEREEGNGTSSTANSVDRCSAGEIRSVAVRTGEPLIDFAWCPFMAGPDDDNAAVLTSCRSNPIYLCDVNTGNKRACYVNVGDNDRPNTAHCLHWDSDSMLRIAAGYESSDLAFFDVTRPGRQPESKYNCRKLISSSGGKSIVGALDYTPGRGLYAIGSMKHPGTIEFMSHKTLTCSGVVAPPTKDGGSGIVQLKFDASGTYLFSASRGGNSGAGDILVWDLRNLLAGPVHRVNRSNNRQQPVYFSLGEKAGCDSPSLFTGCSSAPNTLLSAEQWCSRTISRLPIAIEDASAGSEQTMFVNSVDSFVHPTTGKVVVAAAQGQREVPLNDRYHNCDNEVVKKFESRKSTFWKRNEMVESLVIGRKSNPKDDGAAAAVTPTRRIKRGRATPAAATTTDGIVEISDVEDDVTPRKDEERRVTSTLTFLHG